MGKGDEDETINARAHALGDRRLSALPAGVRNRAMRVIVTGGGGFIGRHLADALRQAGHTVLQVDNRYPLMHATPGERFCDIRELMQLAQVFSDFHPNCVYHLAAYTSVRESFKHTESYLINNILGTWYVLESAQNYGVETFVFISSGGTLYGEPTILPVPRFHPLIPEDIYGLTKLTGEHLTRIICERSGIAWWSLRYPNVYGPGQDGSGEAGVVAIFAKTMLEGRQPTIYGDGQQTRDFMFVRDVVQASLDVLDYPCHEYNVGTGIETPVQVIHDLLRTLTGYVGEPKYEPERVGEVRRMALRPNFLVRMPIPLREGLALTVESIRNGAD